MCSLDFLCPLKDRNNHHAVCRSRRAGVTLNLEPLEERWLPNGTITATSPPAPSFNQAAIALYSDGVNLGVGLANRYFGIDEADAFPVPPAELNANIAFNSPYVGPLAPLLVLAGEIVGADVQYQMQLKSFQFF